MASGTIDGKYYDNIPTPEDWGRAQGELAALRADLQQAKEHWRRCEDGWNTAILQAEGFKAERDAAIERGERDAEFQARFRWWAALAVRSWMDEHGRMKARAEAAEGKLEAHHVMPASFVEAFDCYCPICGDGVVVANVDCAQEEARDD